jgi:hypothetical protein
MKPHSPPMPRPSHHGLPAECPSPNASRRALPVAFLVLVACLAAAGCADTGTATTTLQVRFDGMAADLDAAVDSDLTSRPTAQQSAADGIPHPDGYTAHDQLEDWSRARGQSYTAQSFNGSFGAGYFLTSLAGVTADGATAYWALSINGQASDVGMSEALLRDGDTVTWTYTKTEPVLDPAPIGFTVDTPPPTQNETTTITGSVNHAARISIDGGPALDVPAGRWSLTSPSLAHGRTPATVRAEDGVHSVAVDVVFVRLAPVTIEVLYTIPSHPSSTHTIWMDVDAFASAPQYEGKARPHPGFANVHDAMATWTIQTGTPVDYSYHVNFDFGVVKIDGVGQPLDASAPPYWGYKVNGQTASLGITLQPVAPGDIVTWEFGAGM